MEKETFETRQNNPESDQQEKTSENKESAVKHDAEMVELAIDLTNVPTHNGIRDTLEKIHIERFIPGLENQLVLLEERWAQFKKIVKESKRIREEIKEIRLKEIKALKNKIQYERANLVQEVERKKERLSYLKQRQEQIDSALSGILPVCFEVFVRSYADSGFGARHTYDTAKYEADLRTKKLRKICDIEHHIELYGWDREEFSAPRIKEVSKRSKRLLDVIGVTIKDSEIGETLTEEQQDLFSKILENEKNQNKERIEEIEKWLEAQLPIFEERINKLREAESAIQEPIDVIE
ncbi:MAG: hypothetical protein ACD_50C00345G0005 [uncultured bacterium]|nr:MAG: hypothetical protein ACD_50C00345G0005 [uncultured bacterium]